MAVAASLTVGWIYPRDARVAHWFDGRRSLCGACERPDPPKIAYPTDRLYRWEACRSCLARLEVRGGFTGEFRAWRHWCD